jgi:hypothetical protein
VKLQPIHRSRRFFATALGSGPDEADREWATGWLDDREAVLFDRMRPTDRGHAVAVARAVERHLGELGAEPDRWMMAAALLHDVGKSVPDLGAYGRTVATLSSWIGGADMAEQWADTTGFTRKVGLYMQYPRLGGDLLTVAGSDERVVAWAREHHLPPEEWTVPIDQGQILADADDGRL